MCTNYEGFFLFYFAIIFVWSACSKKSAPLFIFFLFPCACMCWWNERFAFFSCYLFYCKCILSRTASPPTYCITQNVYMKYNFYKVINIPLQFIDLRVFAWIFSLCASFVSNIDNLYFICVRWMSLYFMAITYATEIYTPLHIFSVLYKHFFLLDSVSHKNGSKLTRTQSSPNKNVVQVLYQT